MSKRIRVRRPVTASNPIRDAAGVCYSDDGGCSLQEIVYHCRHMLAVQDNAVCYASEGGVDFHGIFTFGELNRAIPVWQGSPGRSRNTASQTPVFSFSIIQWLCTSVGCWHRIGRGSGLFQ